MTPSKSKLINAATKMDWGQVVANGGPPCFHYEHDSRSFCGRAQRWDGHRVDKTYPCDHTFVSFADLLKHIATQP